jgi:hypothetical protein
VRSPAIGWAWGGSLRPGRRGRGVAPRVDVWINNRRLLQSILNPRIFLLRSMDHGLCLCQGLTDPGDPPPSASGISQRCSGSVGPMLSFFTSLNIRPCRHTHQTKPPSSFDCTLDRRSLPVKKRSFARESVGERGAADLGAGDHLPANGLQITRR